MYYMDSKVFKKLFIPLESAKTILSAQYVIISSRIRLSNARAGMDNIITALSLYPDSSCLSKNDYDNAEFTYREQLDKNEGLLASLIKFSIKKEPNIIFICTRNEMQLKYLKWFADYMYLTYGYPVYPYDEYVNGMDLIPYDEKKVLKKCKKAIKRAKEEKKMNLLETEKGRQKYIQGFQEMSKKKLVKELKKRDLYTPSLTKEEMIDLLEVFPD